MNTSFMTYKEENEALRATILELRRDCAEAYIVLGEVGFDVPEVERALDNLLAASLGEPRPHSDLLPFVVASLS